MPTAPRLVRLCLAACGLAVLAACGESAPPSPVQPADIQSAQGACMAGRSYTDARLDTARARSPLGTTDEDGFTVGIARLDSLLGLRPGHADVLAVRGLCRAARFATDSVQADARAAFADLTAAVDAVTAEPGVFETPLGALYSQRAFVVQNVRPGDWPAAIADFDRAVAAEPRNAVYIFERGMAHAMAGDTARARADLQHFRALAPADAARAAALRGRLDGAAPDTSAPGEPAR